MIIPAGPHQLFVTYYDQDQINEAESEHEVARLVDSQPIIGWVWSEPEDEEDDPPLPRPLTPMGLVERGTVRSIGEDRHKIHQERLDKAIEQWRAKRAAEQEYPSWVVVGVPEIVEKDDGKAMYAQLNMEGRYPDGVFVRFHSWRDDAQGHDVEKLRGKRVQISVDVIE